MLLYELLEVVNEFAFVYIYNKELKLYEKGYAYDLNEKPHDEHMEEVITISSRDEGLIVFTNKRSKNK